MGYWEGEKPGDQPGIPKTHYQAFVELLRALLPGHPSAADARRLLHGPPKELSAALLSLVEGNWRRFLCEQADATGLDIIVEGLEGQARRFAASSFGPAMLDEPIPPDVELLLPGERFRCGFATGFRTTAPYHVFILQSENGHWDALPLRSKTMILEESGKTVALPATAERHRAWYRLKETARDIIEFVAVAVQDRLPEDIKAAIEQGSAIDGARLDALAYFLGAQEPEKVRVVQARRYAPGPR